MKIRKERTHSTKFKSILKSYLGFYNKKLKRKHIIAYIISLIIFSFTLVTFIKNFDGSDQLIAEINNMQYNKNIFMTVFTEKIPIIMLIIISGITPFVYIPIMGIIGYPIAIAANLINVSMMNAVVGCIGGIIQMFGVSLAVAAGIYYCTCSTKRFRYSQSITFGLDDVKEQIYEATKKEDKLKKIRQIKQNKIDKRKKLNVKVEYRHLFITAIISIILVATAALITGV